MPYLLSINDEVCVVVHDVAVARVWREVKRSVCGAFPLVSRFASSELLLTLRPMIVWDQLDCNWVNWKSWDASECFWLKKEHIYIYINIRAFSVVVAWWRSRLCAQWGWSAITLLPPSGHTETDQSRSDGQRHRSWARKHRQKLKLARHIKFQPR